MRPKLPTDSEKDRAISDKYWLDARDKKAKERTETRRYRCTIIIATISIVVTVLLSWQFKAC